MRNAKLFVFLAFLGLSLLPGAAFAQGSDSIARGKRKARSKDYQGAVEEFSKAIQANPKAADAYYNRASSYYKLREYNKALADFSKVIELKPNYSVYLNRGLVYSKVGKNSQAAADFTKAIELNIDLAQRQRRLRKALKPRLVKAYYNRASAYYKSRKYKEALADFSTVIELNKGLGPSQSQSTKAYRNTLARSYYNRGNTHVKLGNNKDAVADFSAAIELNEEYANAFTNRGNAYLKIKKYQDAILDFNKAIGFDPEHEHAYSNRAMAHWKLGKTELALKDFDTAIRLDKAKNPKSPSAKEKIQNHLLKSYSNRANLHYSEKNYEAALTDFGEILKIKPSASTYYNRAMTQSKLGNDKDAVADLSECIALHLDLWKRQRRLRNALKPKLTRAYTQRAEIYFEKRQYQKALADFTKLIGYKSSAGHYFNRGLAFNKLGNDKDAVADYSKALDMHLDLWKRQRRLRNALKPKLIRVYSHRADSYFNLKSYDKALADFTKVIDLKPSSLMYHSRGATYAKLGTHQKAIDDFTKALESSLELWKRQRRLRNSLKARIARDYVHRAMSHNALKKSKEADADLKAAFKYGPKQCGAVFTKLDNDLQEILGLLIDITEQKPAAEAREAVQEALLSAFLMGQANKLGAAEEAALKAMISKSDGKSADPKDQQNIKNATSDSLKVKVQALFELGASKSSLALQALNEARNDKNNLAQAAALRSIRKILAP